MINLDKLEYGDVVRNKETGIPGAVFKEPDGSLIALTKFQITDPEKWELVRNCYFGRYGLSSLSQLPMGQCNNDAEWIITYVDCNEETNLDEREDRIEVCSKHIVDFLVGYEGYLIEPI